MRTIKEFFFTKILIGILFMELSSLQSIAQVSVTLTGVCNSCGTANSPSTNGTAEITSFTNCSTATKGVLTVQTVISEVSQTISVIVGKAGTYNISTSANGITFAGAGLLQVGNQTIVLTATGTPTTAGTSTFTLDTTPNCTFTRSITSAVTPLPANIVLSKISPLFIASVNDEDYAPYSIPTGPATLETNVAADNITETSLVDIQGVIPTTGISILIPYAASGNISLPAFSQTITIPSNFTEDGISRDIKLSWPSGSFTAGNGTITATVAAVGNTLNVKKLDMQTGIGVDGLGWLLGQFSYPINSSGEIASLEIRDIAGIPDRNFADSKHKFLYIPVMSTTGKIWLNNNLGADYNNTTNPYFKPGSQANSFNDRHAFGSLFQWGRYSDGHELIDWNNPNGYYPNAGTTAATTQTGTQSTTDTPGHSLFISTASADWRSTSNTTLWQGASGINNVCPVGWRVPTIAELITEVTANSMTSTENAWQLGLKFPTSGSRGQNQTNPISIWNQGDYINIWSSTIGTTSGYSKFLQFVGPGTNNSPTNYATFPVKNNETTRATGYPIRCIMD